MTLSTLLKETLLVSNSIIVSLMLSLYFLSLNVFISGSSIKETSCSSSLFLVSRKATLSSRAALSSSMLSSSP